MLSCEVETAGGEVELRWMLWKAANVVRLGGGALCSLRVIWSTARCLRNITKGMASAKLVPTNLKIFYQFPARRNKQFFFK